MTSRSRLRNCARPSGTWRTIFQRLCSPSQRFRIAATDLDSAALACARAGGPYPPDDTAAVPPILAQRYLSPRADGLWASEQLQRSIFFRQHDLLKDPFDTAFDLIVCRNVTIYFTAEAKAQLYRRFQAALRPGGVLFVGGTEVVSRPQTLGFEMIDNSFYRSLRSRG